MLGELGQKSRHFAVDKSCFKADLTGATLGRCMLVLLRRGGMLRPSLQHVKSPSPPLLEPAQCGPLIPINSPAIFSSCPLINPSPLRFTP